MPSITPLELSPRRRELMEAGLHVVAAEGLRGLTHRAVDRRAGLPEGSCSAYFRTREALQTALTAYVAARCGADVAALAHRLEQVDDSGEAASDEVVGLVVGAFEEWLDERELLLARIELSMEATRNPALAEVLAEYRERLVAVVDATIAARGHAHDGRTAEALVAASDGLLSAALQKPVGERRAFLADSLRMVLQAIAPQ